MFLMVLSQIGEKYLRAGAPSSYLELLGKLQKQICSIVGLSLAAFLEPLAHHLK